MEIQLIADVGLVGFPNAGKSSLLKSISGMPVRIANFAFTTLKPQVANVRFADGRCITMADLPGNALSCVVGDFYRLSLDRRDHRGRSRQCRVGASLPEARGTHEVAIVRH